MLVSVAAVAVVAGMIAQHMIWLPYQRKMRDAQTRVRAEQEHLRITEAIAALAPRLAPYEARLPQRESTEAVMSELTQLAEQAEITLTSVEPQPPGVFPGGTRLAVVIKFAGEYHAVGRFISLLESARTYLRVDELDLRAGEPLTVPPPAQTAPRVVANVRAVLSTLYLPPLAQ